MRNGDARPVRGLLDAEDRLRKARRAYGYRWGDMFTSLDTYPIKDSELAAWEVELLREELDRMREFVAGVERDIDRRAAELRHREKVRQLREGTKGRTAAEIETARRLADRLEAKRRAEAGG